LLKNLQESLDNDLAELQKQGGQLSNNKAFADDLGDLEEEARILLEN
jgi:hypothetical protein